MKNKTVRFISAILLMALPLSSHAFEVAVEGGLSIDSPSVSILSGTATAPTLASKSSFTYGVSAGFSMLPGFQLELGLMNLPRHFTTTDGSSNLTDVSFKSWLVPLMVRFTALPLVSVGVGGYYSMGSGQVTTITTPAGGSVGPSTDVDFGSTVGFNKNGVGLMGSVRLGMPILPLVDLLIDGRYLMDLGDRSAITTQSAKFKDLQILAGVAFGF